MQFILGGDFAFTGEVVKPKGGAKDAKPAEGLKPSPPLRRGFFAVHPLHWLHPRGRWRRRGYLPQGGASWGRRGAD